MKFAPAKAMQIIKTGMRANRHTASRRLCHHVTHDIIIASMKPTGDIGGIDNAKQAVIIAHLPVAKAFGHICIQIKSCHFTLSLSGFIATLGTV